MRDTRMSQFAFHTSVLTIVRRGAFALISLAISSTKALAACSDGNALSTSTVSCVTHRAFSEILITPLRLHRRPVTVVGANNRVGRSGYRIAEVPPCGA